MKKQSFLFLLPATILAISGCQETPREPGEQSPSPPCTCIFLRPGHQFLLSNIQVIDEETNTSRKAMETWKEFKGDLDLSFDLLNKKSIELNGHFIIPYLGPKGVQYFRIIRMDQGGEKKDYEKFVTEYCIQYDLNKDPATCEIPPERLEHFRGKTEELAALYLRAKPGPKAPPASHNQTGFNAASNKENAGSLKQVRLIYPEGVRSPSLSIQPPPAKINPGSLSCEVWVLPGEYTANLHMGESSWTARFSEQTGIVAGIHFTQN